MLLELGALTGGLAVRPVQSTELIDLRRALRTDLEVLHEPLRARRGPRLGCEVGQGVLAGALSPVLCAHIVSVRLHEAGDETDDLSSTHFGSTRWCTAVRNRMSSSDGAAAPPESRCRLEKRSASPNGISALRRPCSPPHGLERCSRKQLEAAANSGVRRKRLRKKNDLVLSRAIERDREGCLAGRAFALEHNTSVGSDASSSSIDSRRGWSMRRGATGRGRRRGARRGR